MKRKTTKEILAESFQELAINRNVEKITVKDITDNCGYSPATFYRQFKDKYDLIAWDYMHSTNRIMEQIGNVDYAWKDTLIDGMKYFYEMRDYLKNLITNTGGHDAFARCMAEVNVELLSHEIAKSTGGKISMEIENYIKIYCYGTVQFICEWIMGGLKVKPEEMAKICEKALPQPLSEFLYEVRNENRN